ncbi:hypothetical protein [Sphingomicrobium clamense]|uniref:Uncharacterized protein n=1 Tax=Sphingomicrobium clamense TaxID=2851013 RepID=A0ABS6V5K7_9SPHN|nr:hypothetical protein [Sphingomicrobium sp. B8]MBW0144776.1 hypothetical protein [Sphingomicrobium sp. B8]
MEGARQDWWIIGSTAVALHGRDPGGIADIDVMLSVEDAERLLEPRAILPENKPPHPQFHSAWFARWDGTPVPVEFMAGFSMYEDGDWQRVTLETRQEIDLNGHRLFVPSVDELRSLFLRFGRGKDLQRAASL